MAAGAEVIVVGAGPVGLLAACELARRAVPVRLIDKLPTPTSQSRAIVVHARSLEMLDRVGVVDEVIASGVKTDSLRMLANGRELVHLDLTQVDSPFPFTVTTAQTETERILTTRLSALGVAVERGVELTGLTQDARGVHVVLQHRDGGQERATASFVIGSDGARSSVRSLVGTKLEGSFQGERFRMGDVEAEHDLDPRSMYMYFAPDGPLAVFPMRGSRMRLIGQVPAPAGSPLNPDPSQDDLQRVVDDRAGGIRITSSHWLTEFEIHHAQVPSYRFGRVFLAGDAAHVHSPAGGQGMNTGMQDAFNLAWKLALAVAGRGGETLLDSYHAERHPIAAGVIKFSNALTKGATIHGQLPTRLRNEVAHLVAGVPAVRRAMAETTEEIAVAYPDSPIVCAGGPRHTRVKAGQHEARLPDEMRQWLRAAGGPPGTGHVVLTITGDAPATPPGPAAQQDAASVLVSEGGAGVPGYDSVVADPDRTVAVAYGLPGGGRVVIRPDGYVGLIDGLDSDTAKYFAALAS